MSTQEDTDIAKETEVSGGVNVNPDDTSCRQNERPRRTVRPPQRLIDESWDADKERSRSLLVRRRETLSRQLLRANNLLQSQGSRQRLSDIMAKLEISLKDFEEINDKYGSFLDGEDFKQSLQLSEEFNQEVNACLEKIEVQLSEGQQEPPTPTGSLLSLRSSSCASSRSSEASKKARLAELKLIQARKEAEKRRAEEKKKSEDEARRLEEERKRQEEDRRCEEERDIRKLEYEAETSRLAAQLAREEERRDTDSLENRLRDFNDADDRIKNNASIEQSTPFNNLSSKEFTHREKPNATARETEEQLNVSWVQRFCNSSDEPAIEIRDGVGVKSSFVKSLPRLELPTFSGNPLEWPTFISLFKCLVHDQPLTNTQRMTHLQRALTGDAKNAVGGMLNHGHLYRAALTELEEQFGNEETVAAAYLKTIYDHRAVPEDSFGLLRSYSNTVRVAVSTPKSLDYKHDLAATNNVRRAVSKLPETLKGKWGEEKVKMLPKVLTLADFDNWLRVRVRAKSLIQDQTTGGKFGKNQGRRGGKPDDNRKDSPSDVSSFATMVQGDGKATEVINCPVCCQGHNIEDCDTLKAMDVDQRAQAAKEKNLCFSCLSSSEHRARRCDQQKRCGVENCDKRHHLLIHGAARVFAGTTGVKHSSRTVLLQIVPIMVQTSRGKTVKTYALLDSGSQATLVLERFATQIGLDGKEEVLNIGTVNSKKDACRSKKISFSVSSTVKTNNEWLTVDEAWTIPRLNLPEQKVTNSMIQSWPHLECQMFPEKRFQRLIPRT